jgi:endonuclease-3 related protein
MPAPEDRVRTMFTTLYQRWGPQHWWPAESAFEMIVGAYLTQNTSWTNVEKALARLRDHGVLTLDGVRQISLARLQRLVRPAGYFRQKSRRLKLFVRFLDSRFDGSLSRFLAQPPAVLRAQLLELNGVGPETADSIVLYAANHPVFVVDAYTQRILQRHDLLPEGASYDAAQSLVAAALRPLGTRFQPRPAETLGPPEQRGAAHVPSAMSTAPRSITTQVYGEMHALLVGIGKDYCRKSEARCEQCPLAELLDPQTGGRVEVRKVRRAKVRKVKTRRARPGPRRRSRRARL